MTIGLAVALAAGCSKEAGGSGAAQASGVVTVPFVGCAEDGSGGPVEAPTGAPKAVRLDAATAAKLAYYSLAQGHGVLAPRGWHCFGAYGTEDSTLYVTPEPIGAAETTDIAWSGLGGPMVELFVSSDDVNGRMDVVQYIARVFPAHRAYAVSVLAQYHQSIDSIQPGPPSTDTITRRGDELVEYETPANTDGFGLSERLKRSDDPIAGVAVLRRHESAVAFAAVRLPAALRGLAPAIIGQVEQDNPPGR